MGVGWTSNTYNIWGFVKSVWCWVSIPIQRAPVPDQAYLLAFFSFSDHQSPQLQLPPTFFSSWLHIVLKFWPKDHSPPSSQPALPSHWESENVGLFYNIVAAFNQALVLGPTVAHPSSPLPRVTFLKYKAREWLLYTVYGGPCPLNLGSPLATREQLRPAPLFTTQSTQTLGPSQTAQLTIWRHMFLCPK